MEIELTSVRPDGKWTWRASGAREPRGLMEGGLVPNKSVVGDVLRVDANQDVDGIVVTAVLPPRASRDEPERLEVLGSGENQPTVTTTLATRKGGRRGDKHHDGKHGQPSSRDSLGHRKNAARNRSENTGRKRRKQSSTPSEESKPDHREHRSRSRNSQTGNQGDKSRQQTRNQSDRQRSRKPAKSLDGPPKAKRLRPKRKHRNLVLADLPEEQRRVAEILIRSGIPGLRAAIDSQNQIAREAAEPEIPSELLLRFAEQIHPQLRDADWLDRAEAAVSGVEKIDLRDLRAVVVASESAARSNESRVLASQLQTALTARVEREHNAWIIEVTKAIDENRCVRALRLSSRPPKAGAPLPAPTLSRLEELANNALSSDTSQGRWATLLDAVALSPVHQRVVPVGLPSDPSDDLLELVKRISTSTPQIAILFGVKPTERPRRRVSSVR